jgi:hypothetical protein
MNIEKKVRQSPTESATHFAIGTKKKGNDGNMWIIKIGTNNVKRWTRYDAKKSTNNSNKKCTIHSIDPKKNIKEFNLNACGIAPLTQIKNVEKIKLSSNNVSIGESMYATLPAKKGLNMIYKINDALIIAPVDVNIEKIFEGNFVLTNNTVGVDAGLYGFYDTQELERAIQVLSSVKVKTYKRSLPFPAQSLSLKMETKKKFSVTKHDFDKMPINEPNLIVGYLFSNGSGDGYFPIYKHKIPNVYMIMSLSLLDKIYKHH